MTVQISVVLARQSGNGQRTMLSSDEIKDVEHFVERLGNSAIGERAIADRDASKIVSIRWGSALFHW